MTSRVPISAIVVNARRVCFRWGFVVFTVGVSWIPIVEKSHSAHTTRPLATSIVVLSAPRLSLFFGYDVSRGASLGRAVIHRSKNLNENTAELVQTRMSSWK